MGYRRGGRNGGSERLNTRPAICVLCYATFEATTSYGLCHACWQRDKLREWDRLQSAYKDARRAKVPATLELPEWLSILSDFNGRCAYCLVSWYARIACVDERKGLVKGNVVPICLACREHKLLSWGEAVSRVQAYIDGAHLQDIFEDVGIVSETSLD